ncbi:serine dehydratase subunit alpha family protein [Treponema sp.]
MDLGMNRGFLNILKAEVKPAIGCTEPAAVALSCAKGRLFLPGELASLQVSVGRNVFKNGLMVGIPGTLQKGLVVAAALGYVCGNADAGLEVLGSIDPSGARLAEKMVLDKTVSVVLDEAHQGVYVKSILTDREGNQVQVVLEGAHDRIVQILVNGQERYANSLSEVKEKNDDALSQLSIETIFAFARDVKIEDIRFILESAEMNMRVAEEGLSTEYGMAIGRTMYSEAGKASALGRLEAEAIHRAAALAASASDARMAGSSMSVMTNSGSGNQGITATVPVHSIAVGMNAPQETLIRALCLSQLLSIYFKYRSEKLSAFCGTVTAAIGAASGVGFLYGAGQREVEAIINLAFSGISGMICDGAKSSCALKIFLALENALSSTKLALERHHIPYGEGIIGQRAEQTIGNIQKLSTDGMRATDEVILRMMNT